LQPQVIKNNPTKAIEVETEKEKAKEKKINGYKCLVISILQAPRSANCRFGDNFFS
jgi:uracil phosphoribosyltransferase